MTLIENLLFRSESESLDFKRDQYAFVGATDEQKAKLLKDILAMANSWRGETAHILVGVDAPLGSPPSVVGITQSLDDAALQQFVNAKTQRPVEFRYFETDVANKRVGVIEIPVQRRPVYCVAAFASVRANVVYTRRGSSNSEASPDEIARMGAAISDLQGSELEVAFAVPAGRQLVGTSLKVECVNITTEEGDDIPDYEEESDGFGLRVSALLGANRDFWRELVDYIKTTELARPVALTVSNRGKSAAREIRLELKIDDPDEDLIFIKEADMPDQPAQKHNYALLNVPRAMAAAMKTPPFEVEYVDGAWHLALNFGTLQPARTLFPPIAFFAGSKRSKMVEVTASVLADNLPAAAECRLSIHFNTTERTMNLDAFENEHSKRLAEGFEE